MSTVERNVIATVTDDITALGMKLAGIGEVAAVKEGETSSKYITQYANDPSVAVLIVTERIGEENRMLLNRITQRPWPVVVEIPGPEGKMARETSSLKDLVRRALGIEMDI
ncbi:MAG: V-type ATP synthase subunit F [Candidatus Kariarchaeaceae archaeon]|jgi:vacuolar-type H+-ATPase subunit F/Vma7